MTISSRCSGRVACSSFGKPGSARATEIADTGTNLPTQAKLGNTTSSALGLTINTLADRDEASTNVCPTMTPYSSVKVLEGSTKAQQFGRTPDTEDPADVGGTTAALPYPATHPSRYWPPQITYHNTVPEKTTVNSSSPFTVKGDESAETNRR